MLAKCGFADPDRKDPMHDAACAYVASRALDLYRKLIREEAWSASAVLEQPISKGTGQYMTTVGFLDLSITAKEWVGSSSYVGDMRGSQDIVDICRAGGLAWTRKGLYGQEEWVQTKSTLITTQPVLGVEVKWSESSVSDAVHQICLYREYLPDLSWALATPWNVNVEQKAALESQKISYVRLSESMVREFATRMRSLPATAEAVL